MVAQHPPFAAASARDPHYKLLSTNKHELFWKVHTKRKEGGLDFFSEDFRSLLSGMLSYNPHERPSLAEIKAHPWFNGPVPTYDQVKEEFEQRKTNLETSNNQEDEAMPDCVIDPSVFQTNAVYKSVGDGEEEKISEIDRKVATYIPEYKRYTEFYSTSSVNDLFKTVATFGQDCAQECTYDDEEYSASLKVKSGDNIIELSVNILKIDDDKNCVEIIKEKGTKFEFHDIYHQIKKFFGGHANTTL